MFRCWVPPKNANNERRIEILHVGLNQIRGNRLSENHHIWEELAGDIQNHPENLYTLSQEFSDDRVRRLADHICLGNELYPAAIRSHLAKRIADPAEATLALAIRQIEFALYIELARRSRADRRKVKVYKRQNRVLRGTGFQLIEQSRGLFAFEQRMAAELHAVVFNGFSFNLPASSLKPLSLSSLSS
jgi:hypothetical protein